jgi:hypothetical protein
MISGLRRRRVARVDTAAAAALVVSCCALTLGCGDGRLQAFVLPGSELQPAESGALDASVPLPPALGAGGSGALLPRQPEPTPDEPSRELLVDDLEDADLHLPGLHSGFWYAFSDKTGVQDLCVEEPLAAREGSQYALHTTGSGFRSWGAGVGLALGEQISLHERGELDASSYEAVAFWARVDSGSDQRVDLHLLNPDRDGDLDFEHYAIKLVLTSHWQRIVVRFDRLVHFRGPVRLAGELDPARLIHLQFLFLYANSFSVWLDDIAFVRDCAACAGPVR